MEMVRKCSAKGCKKSVLEDRKFCPMHRWRLHHHGILDISKSQSRELNNNWRGNHVGYSACHYRVTKERGSPKICEICGTKEKRIYNWANLTGNYTDIYDYKRMCVSCHRKYDAKIRKQNKKSRLAELRKDVS